MTLPATFHQAEVAEAERFADQWVEQCLDEDWLGIGISMLHPNTGAIMMYRSVKLLFEGNIFYRPHILQAALNGFMPARKALGELVVEIRKEDWPDELGTFARACANPHFHWPSGKRGAKRLSHLYSDIAVVVLILQLAKRFPSIPTTGRSARQTCHSDIAAGAFSKYSDRTGRGKMTRGQVKKIWLRYKRYQIRGISDPKVLNIFNTLSGEKLGL
jgi:hypothetical protein